ncbi:MAG: hypothetical protein HY858_17145 [Candidatus Solibacter usitatus]|nr:hypothetical protein [Candidatus Solibacter usitatus]
MPVSVTSEDRVLLTSLRDRTHLPALAAGHLLVGLGTGEEVRAARREMAAHDNVMFIAGHRDDIPWRPAWFTLIVDPGGGEQSSAIERSLAPSGRIVTIL